MLYCRKNRERSECCTVERIKNGVSVVYTVERIENGVSVVYTVERTENGVSVVYTVERTENGVSVVLSQNAAFSTKSREHISNPEKYTTK